MTILSDVKRVSLIACLTALAVAVITVWRGTQQMFPLITQQPVWWAVPLLLVLLISSAIMPVFYFALWRDPGTLRFSRSLLKLSLVAAVVYGASVAIGLYGLITASARDPRLLTNLPALAGELSALAYIALLVALSRQPEGGAFTESDVPVSRLLRLITKFALIVWSIWILVNLVRLVLTPYQYFQARNYMYRAGQEPPPLWPIMLAATRTLLEQAALFVAPYVVYNSWLRVESVATPPPTAAPDELAPGAAD